MKIQKKAEIQKIFGTDYLTTERISDNCSFGFFVTHFGDDADNKWNEAHPFKYELHDSINYGIIDSEFIKKHFDLFAGKQFQVTSGWKWEKGMPHAIWDINTFFVDVTPQFKDDSFMYIRS